MLQFSSKAHTLLPRLPTLFLRIRMADHFPAAAVGCARTASSFIYDKAYVGGQWVSAKSGSTFEGNVHRNNNLLTQIQYRCKDSVLSNLCNLHRL